MFCSNGELLHSFKSGCEIIVLHFRELSHSGMAGNMGCGKLYQEARRALERLLSF